MFRLYSILTYMVYPIYYLYFMPKRVRTYKEDKARYKEKFGHYNTERPKNNIIWFHAASVGETLSILGLITKIMNCHQDITILVTTGTISSAEIVKRKFPKQIIHQYAPLDFNFCVERFLKYWRPNVAVLVESELWPNLIRALNNYNIPSYMLNMRMSAFSLRKWLMVDSMFKKLLSVFNKILTQTNSLAKTLKQHGIHNVDFYGNLKFANNNFDDDEELITHLKTKIKVTNPWVATSTHFGEEEVVLQAHKQIKSAINDTCLILIPRHPDRCEDIIKTIKKYNFSYLYYSEIKDKKFAHDVLLIDTIGIAKTFYSIADCALIGGSLQKGIGGHNVIEPLTRQCVPLYGEYTENFKEITDSIEKLNAGCKIKNYHELSINVIDIMNDIRLRDTYIKNAKLVLNPYSSIVDKIYNVLKVAVN